MVNRQLLFVVIMFSWLIIDTTLLVLVQVSGSAAIAKPGCQDRCGDVSIPFPFGIGSRKCYFDDWFEIGCDNSASTPKPLLNRTKLEVFNISTDYFYCRYDNKSRTMSSSSGRIKYFKNCGKVKRFQGNPVAGHLWLFMSYSQLQIIDLPKPQQLQVRNPITFMNCTNHKESTVQPLNLTGSPFIFSNAYNQFVAVSCDMDASMSLNSIEAKISSGCSSICSTTDNSSACTGVNCCQTTIPSNTTVFNTTFQSQTPEARKQCKYAFVVDVDWFNTTNFVAIRDMTSVPVTLDWSFYGSEVEVFGQNLTGNMSHNIPYCDTYDSFYSVNRTELYCRCWPGFEGNPYIDEGCQDVDECRLNPEYCKGDTCVNTIGSYKCKKPKIKMILTGFGSGLGALFLLIGVWCLYKFIKKRQAIKRKKQFFKRNGGLLLQQQVSSGEVNFDTRTKLFNSKELQKATNNFNPDRVLGQGGQGTVYKGMLADGKIVAVKKSKIVDEAKLTEFINEVIILSQINHRNVVKLLGCCLETEVPLLVYEFIPNGTLSQYIHEQNEDEVIPFTWEMRLRIATEIVGALSYLHSAASFPIYHRDIKSSNILLDEKYRAKVADFGTSRSIAIEQTHLTTVVHGTFGYLDPEYFQSSQFTEKSDVYSFGVVIVELLTGQKPISMTRLEEGRSLASYFIMCMEENRLFEIIDARIIKEQRDKEIMEVAELAKRCLSLNGKYRPTMKEVATELEAIQKSFETCSTQQNHEEIEYTIAQAWDFPTSIGLDPSTGTSSLPLLL